jgi:hypothetical protein
MEINDAYRK